MKVTFILPSFPASPSGGHKIVYEYANNLTRKGHQIYIVYPLRFSYTSLFYKQLLKIKDCLYHIFFKPKVSWYNLDKRIEILFVPYPIAKYIPDSDAIFATWWQTAEFIQKYPASKGEKFHLIQGYEVWGGPKDKVDATWRLPLHKVVVAKWLYQKGIDLNVSKDEMIHIPNAINNEIFRLTKSIETRPNKVSMMYSSNEWKGSADGLIALRLVKQQLPSLKAVLFGIETRPKLLPSWIKYIQNPSKSMLVGQIYNASSTYLCSSWTEGWHIPPAEAMACGCAVVSTDIEGVKDYCEHEKTALLSPPKIPNELANNLFKVLINRDLRIKIAKEGYKKINEFTWEKSTNLLEQFIKRYVKI